MSRSLKNFLSTTCINAAIMAIAVGHAYANPQDGVVSSGSANITTVGNTLNINQSTDRAVIDWRSFDIGASETTHFYQPSTSSVTLNRVNSSSPSFIDGHLIANGNIFVVNQNGVLFGQNSKVDVNGLVASTADITNANFMAGNFRFDQAGNPNATIENRGQITAGEAGLIGLVAPNVLNSGIIHARMGRVHLASGDTATVDLYGDGLIEVAAIDSSNQRIVENTGKITAEGGTIAMTAAAGAHMVNSLIRVSGELHAPSVGVKNGKIIIAAEGSNAVKGNVKSNKGKKSGSSTVIIDGLLDVSGKNSGEKGGSITITADHIAVMSAAVLNASGYAGGGTVHIGGEYLGEGETPAADYTIVQTGAVINASATDVGNGGEAIVYSDGNTEFGGTIISDGAGDYGDGGFAETSGKENLLAMGTVQLRAGRRGRAGTWLLDPADITITASTNTNITGSPTFTASGTGSQVSAANIKTLLDAGTNVSIVTSNDGYAGNGDILVNSAITTTGSGALTLSAFRNITVNSAITLNGGSLTLRSDNTGIGDGSVASFAGISTNGGNITIGGGSGAITAGSGFAVGNSAQPAGVFLSAVVNAAGGNIIMNGSAYSAAGANRYGVYTSSNIATTGAGTITINGVGTGAANTGFANIGVWIVNGGNVSTQNGLLSVIGVDQTTGAGSSWGVYISPAGTSTVRTTGSGDINITGTARTVSGGTAIATTLTNAVQTTGAGNIVLKAIAGYAGIYATAANAMNTASGNISIYSDSYIANVASAINSGNNLTLASYSNRGMSLGTNVAGTSNIDNTTLGNLTAGSTYIFGSVLTGAGAANTGDVTITTTRDFGTKNVTFVSGNDINLAGTLTKATGAGTANYILQAYGNIYNTSSAVVTATTGAINLTLQSDYNANNDGAINLSGGTFYTNGGNITLGGGSGTITSGSGYAVGNSTYIRGVSLASALNAVGGNIIINGQGANLTADSNYGVYTTLNVTTSNTGSIFINGIGGGNTTSNNNYGVRWAGGAISQSGATGSINIVGVGGNTTGSGNNNIGVYSAIAGGLSTSGGAAINITGTGSNSSGGANYGIQLNNASVAGSGGTVTLAGVGGSGRSSTLSNSGIYTGGTSSITNSGNIIITGTSGSGSGFVNSSHGVSMSGTVTATGAGAITISGTGASNPAGGGYSNNGVNFSGLTVSAAGGAIQIIGQAGATNSGNEGVRMSSSNITNTGSGTITINGTGNITSGYNSGFGVDIISSTIATADGNLIITGVGSSGGGASNHGVTVSAAGVVSSVNGNVIITGTGGGNTSATQNYGVYITGTGSTIKTTGTGALTVVGTGGNLAGTGGTNHGVYSAVANGLQTTGSGSLTIKAVKGGQASSYGIISGIANAITTTGTGNITLFSDTFSLTTANSINSSGILTTATYSNATMGVGSSSGYTLNLDNTTLGNMNGTSYVFGSLLTGTGTSNTNALTIETTRDFVDKNVSFVSGDNITLAANLTKATGAGTANYLFQAKGNISNSASAGVTASSGAINLTLNSDYDVSGAGNISLTSSGLLTNNGTITMNSNGQSVTMSGTVGGTTTINSSNGAVSIGALDGTTAGTKDVIVNAGTATFTTTGAIGATNKLRNLTINADDIVLGANVGGTGILTLQQTSANRAVYLNYGTADGTNFNLGSTELGRLVSGWSNINIGNTATSVTGFYGATTWLDPVTFRASAGRILSGATSASGTASLTFTGSGGWVDLYADITTAGGNVDMSGISYLYMSTSGAAAKYITTNGGNVSIPLLFLSGRDLVVNAGTGNVAFGSTVQGTRDLTVTGSTITTTGGWGTATALGNVTLNSVNSVILRAMTFTAGKTLTVDVSGAGNSITTTGAIATGAAGNISFTADDVVLGGNLSGTGTLTLQPYSTSRVINLNRGTADGTNFNLSTAEMGYFVDGWGTINIGRTNGADSLYMGNTTWIDPVVFRNNFRVDMPGTLTATGNASVAFIIGTSGWLNQNAITTAGQNVSVSSGVTIAIANNITTNGGSISVGSVQISSGGISNPTWSTSGGNITIGSFISRNSSGTSTSGKTFNLNAGSGNLSFGGTVNGDYNLTATAASISTNGIWGGSEGLGDTTLTSVNNISLPSITTAAGKTVDVTVTGAGNNITTTGAIATGNAGNISLTADDLILGGNLSGTGTVTLRPNSASKIVRVNSSTGDFNLSTADIAFISNGWNLINIGRTDSSAAMYLGTSAWTDPVYFRTANSHVIYGTITTTDNATQTYQSASSGTNFVGGGINSDGAVLMNGYVWMSAAANIATTNDNITLGNLVYVGPALTMNAGTGNVSVTGLIRRSGSAGASDLNINAGTIAFGNDIGTTTSILDNVSLVSANSLTLPTIYANNIFAQTTGATSDITIGAGKTLTASGSGDAVKLVSARNFINNGSASSIVLTGAGRWISYSTEPSANTLNGLTTDFLRYGCTYNGSCPSGVTIPGTGNGSVYTYRPTITVTPTAVAATYGNAVNLTNYAYATTGYLTGAAGNDSSADSLTGTVSGVTTYLQGSDIGNYNINYNTGTLTSSLGYLISYANNATALTVGKRTLTIGLTGTVDKIYDGTNTASMASGNYNLSNFYGSDATTVSILNSSATYDDKNVGSGKTLSVSGLSLSGAKSGNYQLSTTSLSGAIGNVTKKALSIVGLSGVDRVYNGMTNAGITGTAALSGDVAGDDVTISITGSGTFADKNVGTAKVITVNGYNIGGVDAGNYDLTQPSTLTADVTKATLNIGATANNITYNGSTSATATLNDNRISGDNLTTSYTSASFSDKDAGVGKTVTISGINVTGTDVGNYNFNTTATTAADISKKALTVGAGSETVIYGTTVPSTSINYNGFIVGEDQTFLNTAPVLASAHSGIVNAGSYVGNYTLSGGVDTNYSFTYIAGDLTVNKKTLNVTADGRTVTYGITTPGSSNLSYNGFITGEDETFLTVAPTAASTLSGTQNAGTYLNNYIVSGGVSNNYQFNYFNGNLVVAKRNLAVSADNKSVSYGASVPTGSISYSGFVLGQDATALSSFPTVSSVASGVVNAGSYANNYVVSGGSATNYNLIYSSGDLNITQIGVNVTVNNKNVIYGTSVPTTSLVYSGFVNGDDETVLSTLPTITSSHSGVVNAGTYLGNYVASGAVASNYTFNYIDGNLVVSPKVLNVTAGNRTITYGDAIVLPGLTYTGFISGENVSFLTSAPIITSLQSGITNAGTYTGNFLVSGGASNNYTFNYVAGDLNVTKKSLMVAANNQTISYGAVVPGTTTLLYSGFVNGENSTVIDSLPIVTSALSGVQNTGTYTGNYMVGGATDNNYSFTYIAGNLIITGSGTPPTPPVITPPTPAPVSVAPSLPNTFVYTSQNPIVNYVYTPTLSLTNISYQIQNDNNEEDASSSDVGMSSLHRLGQNSTGALVIEISPELARRLALDQGEVSNF